MSRLGMVGRRGQSTFPGNDAEVTEGATGTVSSGSCLPISGPSMAVSGRLAAGTPASSAPPSSKLEPRRAREPLTILLGTFLGWLADWTNHSVPWGGRLALTGKGRALQPADHQERAGQIKLSNKSTTLLDFTFPQGTFRGV